MILDNTIIYFENNFLFFPGFLFLLGFIGAAYGRKNLLLLLVSVELMLLAASLNFIFFSIFLEDASGQLYTLIILAVAAAESAIGLAILIVVFRIKDDVDFYKLRAMRG